jgi:hypothetical protein
VNMRNFVLRSSICAHALAYVSVLPASNHAWAQAFDISAYYTNQSPAVSSNKEPTKSVSVRDYLRFALGPVLGGGGALYFYGTVAQPCKVEPTLLVLPVRAGTEIIEKIRGNMTVQKAAALSFLLVHRLFVGFFPKK